MYLALKNALGKSFILFSGLLNKFSGASAAYSLRRLGSYNSSIVRIRRVSDATEVNVGFNGTSSVDTTSPITVVSGSTTASTLGAFLTEGGNQDATVHTWYDQSGNGNDLIQSSTSLQPQIATSGSLNTVNGKPSIKWDGVNDFMVASISGFQDITNLSSFHVVTPVDAAAANTGSMTAFSFGVISSGTNRGLGLASATGAPGINGETITLIHESSGATTGRLASTSYSRAANTQSLLSLFNLSSGTSLFAQGSSVTLNLSHQINTSSDTSPSGTGFTSNNDVYLGALFTTAASNLEEESFQEIIFFDADKTSDRISIESNITDYYNI
jgi:hypothetical protein